MIKHVLVGFDGSEPARKALRFAHELATQAHAKLTVQHVLELPRILPIAPLDGFVVTAPGNDAADVELARTMLDQAVAELPAGEIVPLVTIGESVVEVLCREGARLDVDLIVVGARGRNPAGRWLLGSVSDRVVHHAGRPVTVVH